LISPESLVQNARPICLLDTRPGADVFRAAHLQGALHADLNVALSGATDPALNPARGGRHPLPPIDKWAKQLGEWGIGPDTFVVAYDGASGGNGACRLWWMLRASGHERVAVLDGGFQAALAAGFKQSSGESPRLPSQPAYPVRSWQLPIASMDEVAQRSSDPSWKVLDVRARARWRGEEEPIDPVKGRIPGSVNLPFSENLDQQQRYKAPELLRVAYLELLSGTPPEHLIVHCGSGVTACHTLLALELAGLTGAALYVGSYSEWCRSGNPLASGG